MTPESVMTLGRQALELTLMVSAPPLLAALIIGLVVSIFQAATQINEMTLSFIPKLIGMFVVLIITGPWMVSMMVDYIQRLFSSIPGWSANAGSAEMGRVYDQCYQRPAIRLAGPVHLSVYAHSCPDCQFTGAGQ